MNAVDPGPVASAVMGVDLVTLTAPPPAHNALNRLPPAAVVESVNHRVRRASIRCHCCLRHVKRRRFFASRQRPSTR